MYWLSLCESSFSENRDIRCIWNCLDHKFTTLLLPLPPLIHSRLGYCNHLFLNLPVSLINSQCYCSRCHQNTKILSHLFFFKISSLAQNYLTHSVQNTLFYLKSFQNLPTSLPSKPSHFSAYIYQLDRFPLFVELPVN
jgi:hypothetical protein